MDRNILSANEKTKVTNIIFDLDGTIIDSEPGVNKCLHYAFDAYNFTDYEEKDLREFLGPPLNFMMKSFTHSDDETAKGMIKKFRELYTQSGMYENNLYEGIIECIEKLNANGFRCYIATSKVLLYVKDIFLKHGINPDELFADVCGSVPDEGIKTKSDVIDNLLNRNEITDVNSCLMIGDRFYDVEGAKEFNIKTIGVLYGYGTEEELLTAGAVKCVKTAEELTDYLLAL